MRLGGDRLGRMKRLLPLLVAGMLIVNVPAQDAVPMRLRDDQSNAIKDWVKRHLADSVKTYKHLHANPELSFEELKTGALVADAWEKAGFTVTRKVGRTGMVGVLKNGAGPTVLIRGDMDALPVTEKTGLPYASKVQIKRPDGTTTGAMHACGHDVHSTMVIGMGQMLLDLRRHWSGTVVLVANLPRRSARGRKR